MILKNEKVLIGAQDFNLNPGERYAMDYMIFNDKGEYIVDFVDKEDNYIAKKRIEIL